MFADLEQGLIAQVDAFVHTGDVTDNGAAAEDSYSKTWLLDAAKGVPSLVVPGNHDLWKRTPNTRTAWEITYQRSGNTVVELADYLLIGFSPDAYALNTTTGWPIPAVTLAWMDGLCSSTSKRVVLADHYPPAELGVLTQDSVQPAAGLADLIDSHPNIVGMLCGHMHREIDDPRAATFAAIGGRKIPVLCDVSSMLSIDGQSRDISAQFQSYSAYVTLFEDRWEVRYRAHGTHAWSGPAGLRVTTLDLAEASVTRSM